MNNNIIGIILAGGKGKRINSKKVNKVTLSFWGKPMIVYGIELLETICNKLIIVVGAFSHSVKATLEDYNVLYAYQAKRLGTGHAAKIGCGIAKKYSPTYVLISYGDHLMFYKKETILKLIELHQKEKAVVSLISAIHQSPSDLAWGRIIRDSDDHIIDIVEEKDATDEEKKIKELNAGFYCFDFKFLSENINKLKKSPVTKEYYLTYMIKIAAHQGKKVVGLKVPYEEVGMGVNKHEELDKSQQIFRQVRQKRS